MLRLVGFALLLFLFVLSFLGYFLTAQRLRTPLPPEAVVVKRGGQAFTLRARLARTPEAWRLGLGLRQEDLEALLYLFPEATDAPFSTEGYRFPVVVAFLDGEGRVLKVARLEPGESVAPGTAYRGVLEVRAGAFEPRPGDRVLP
ncbi:DUF192 domain-containing protein [Thermus sp.]|uniref:DUF192 domain-containing protein n=1 Tax=Thermus sp. TaxID=275 RepID=UPI00307FAD62